MGKTMYGWSSKTGKLLMVGDEENFPKKEGHPVFLVITVLSLSAVLVSAVLVFGK